MCTKQPEDIVKRSKRPALIALYNIWPRNGLDLFFQQRGLHRAKPFKTSISCHRQTRATRCITANMLQTNKVDAQCDELATELS